MDSPRIIYTPCPDVTPEAELNALVNVYAYLLKHHDSRKAAQSAQHSGRDNSMRFVDEQRRRA
jgi:hypothetical protein